MPRQQIPITKFLPYHVTARCINREWFSLPLCEVWSIMEDYLHFISRAFEIKLHCFVLMDNHFHLILQNPKGNLSEAMNYFMRETSRQIARKSNRVNQVYGARFHRTLIPTERYYYHAYKYVYRNPVRAGVCNLVQEYPYSTIAGLLGIRKLSIPIIDSMLFCEGGLNYHKLDWLNEVPTIKADRDIRLALRRREYQLPKDKNTKKLSILEEISLY